MSISVTSPIPFSLILGHQGDVLCVQAAAYIASILYTLDSVPCIRIYMRVCDDLKKVLNFCERIDPEAILVLLILVVFLVWLVPRWFHFTIGSIYKTIFSPSLG